MEPIQAGFDEWQSLRRFALGHEVKLEVELPCFGIGVSLFGDTQHFEDRGLLVADTREQIFEFLNVEKEYVLQREWIRLTKLLFEVSTEAVVKGLSDIAAASEIK